MEMVSGRQRMSLGFQRRLAGLPEPLEADHGNPTVLVAMLRLRVDLLALQAEWKGI